ncbi:hypothetical protein BRC81_00310 [Halobacteriales archaeon QS_1_68_20]|nr:MAG: hypothetical protein BRC81_00310 [Halobacteriales archaeon QS_1_68_20]
MRVVVLGCGYLGNELGRQLGSAGHDVVGVRRSADGLAAVEDAGLDAVRADVTDPTDLAAVPDADWVVYAASAGSGDPAAARAAYVDGLRTAIEQFGGRADPPDRFLYVSSTGVYGDRDGTWVDEETPPAPETERERILATAERVALDATEEAGIDGTVARLGGIYGPDRYRLQRFLEGPVVAGHLNAVHREDAGGAIRHLLDGDHARGEVVLVVDDEPVDKQAFADWLAEQCGVPEPPKRTREAVRADDSLSDASKRRRLADKRCSNAKLRGLGYDFAYPTVREGYRPAIEAYRESRDGGDSNDGDPPHTDGGASVSDRVDLDPGDSFTTAARTITEADVVNFAGVSGDFNYLHVDAERTADAEYGERVAHGALVFSVATGLIWQARDRGDVVAFYGVDDLRFVAPVFVGDTVHAEVTVTEIEGTDAPDAEALVRHEVRVRDQDDEVVMTFEPLALVG